MRRTLLTIVCFAAVCLFSAKVYAQSDVFIRDPETNTYRAQIDSDGNLAVKDSNTGLSTCYIPSAASTNATSCYAGAAKVYAIHLTNTSAAAVYLRMYNLATEPTCSSATGFVESIPAEPADGYFGKNGRVTPNGQTYSTGIAFCLTDSGESTDNDAVGTGAFVTILYK